MRFLEIPIEVAKQSEIDAWRSGNGPEPQWIDSVGMIDLGRVAAVWRDEDHKTIVSIDKGEGFITIMPYNQLCAAWRQWAEISMGVPDADKG